MEIENDLLEIQQLIYDKCSLKIKNLVIEPESSRYKACMFELNSLKILFREAKISPRKTGQFVTCWKRNRNGQTEPFEEEDNIDFYIINTRFEKLFGQFVIPRSKLVQQGVISSIRGPGKRGFRVYPPWNTTESRQAAKTQAWQLDYFLTIDEAIDIKRAQKLYGLY